MADFDDAKVNSMEARIDAKFDAIQRTLSQISNQLGLRPIEAETSRQTPMVSFIEFPIFTGVDGDLKQWILWLEDFFVRERFTAMEKMNLAQSLLAGKAEAWFYSSQKRRSFRSWEHLLDNMIWRFGDFIDVCDFSDPELFRLWAKNDRILQAQRVETRRKRMATTSLNLQESISNQQKIVEEFPENIAVQLDEIASENTPISQFQVPVSSWEPSLRFSSEPLDVSASWPCEVVSNNLVHSQSVLDCVKNKTNAYQVFDKTSSHKERLKPKTKRKLGLSLKTWMFKFKSTSKRRNSLDVKSFSVEEIAWLMRDSKEIYRSCVDKEFKAVVAGCEKKLFDRFQTSPSYALDVVNKTSKPWETHTTCTSTHVASVNSLSFAVGTVDNFELCVGHETGIMKLKLLLQLGFAGDRLTYGWMVFDRGKNIKILGDVITLKRDDQTRLVVKAKDAHVDSTTSELSALLKDSSNREAESFPILNAATNQPFLWLQKSSENYLIVSEFEKKKQLIDYKTRMFKYKSRFQEISLTDTQFLCEKVQRVSCLSLAAQFNSLEIVQAVLEKIIQGNQEAYTKIFDRLQLNLKQGMDLYGASGHRLFLRQQSSSSIWHRWRRKD